MEAVRSGLCHGPECERRIVPLSPSEDFCSERCAARWNGRWDVTAERVWQAQQRQEGVVWSVLPPADEVPWSYELDGPMPPMLASLKQRGMLRTIEPAVEEHDESALTRPWWRRLLGWLR